ncbi:hypothetical protein ACIP5N_21365 [Streptomyces sp. NPDC088768]|uniref:hypothetical protein n=1 Tax=Streptomyces sp. NPDC088768 TaxID=3365894 RepID=UPI00382538E6
MSRTSAPRTLLTIKAALLGTLPCVLMENPHHDPGATDPVNVFVSTALACGLHLAPSPRTLTFPQATGWHVRYTDHHLSTPPASPPAGTRQPAPPAPYSSSPSTTSASPP